MARDPQDPHFTMLNLHSTEFWSGDIGLTLVTISLVVLIFAIAPLGKAGIIGRIFFDLAMVTLMISGALTIEQSRLSKVLVFASVVASAIVLTVARFYPMALLHQIGSFLATLTLLLYCRIVLVLMFRHGPITWSRIQGGLCAYLLLGMAWASAFEFVEYVRAGSFHFVSPPASVDELSSKLTYFSFSTLTTVGFGDVTPLTSCARSLSIAEAVMGQLFPAVLMAALVAMALQSRSKP
jgi:Ion channel